MGEFVDANYSFKVTREMAVVCILVLLDLQEEISQEVCMNTNIRLSGGAFSMPQVSLDETFGCTM